MMLRYKKVTIKVGSNVLTRADGTLDFTRMSALVDQIAELKRQGVEVVLVSSGAGAAGRSVIHPTNKLDAVSARQLYSSVGQVRLLHRYYMLFSDYGLSCGQVLTTKESLSTRDHYLNQRNCMRVMLDNDVIPIINENDAISVTELMFTDNDELSGLIATMMDHEALIILSNIDGIYNGNPKEPGTEVIREVYPGKRDLSEYIQTSKSSFGRGGMQTKTNIASKVADEGIEVIIANGKRDNILIDLLNSEKDTLCTRFVASPEPTSSVKRWIAHSEGFAKGELHVNANCTLALEEGDSAVSILPVGVNKIVGEFEKDDIVLIFDHEGNQIGVGKAQMSSEEALEKIGKKGEKPIVHYDYLYLFE
ncbi:MAG: glutamate 5-kinase [Paludibacteraceae bacterium]|nr:glutamate 5-kinase [Paludibacteraceae bacterium]